MIRSYENSQSQPSLYKRLAVIGAVAGAVAGGLIFTANAEEAPVQPVPAEVSNSSTTTEVHGECNPDVDVCVPGVTDPTGSTIVVESTFAPKECDEEQDGDNNCGSTTTTSSPTSTTIVVNPTTTTIPRNDCEERNNNQNPNDDCGAGHTN